MKILYCEGCGIKVAEILEGSKIKKLMVCLCEDCNTQRIASDMYNKTSGKKSEDYGYDFLNDLMRGFKK